MATAMAYVLLACIVFFPLVTRLCTHILADDVFIEPGRSDAYNFLWTYWWIQKAVLSWKNFYHCSWVLPPTGANLYFHTHVVLPTLLTVPLGVLLGPVGGYNSMIIFMLSGAALMYCAFLRRVFGTGRVSSFVTGALFGFSPYFVFKTHAHVNLVGGVFWGGALAVLAFAYIQNRWGWREGALFATCVWATFWTSFVEFFALLVACGCMIMAFELDAVVRTRQLPGKTRIAFFSMVLPGALSLLSLRNAPNVHAVDIAPFPNVHLLDLVIPARLSIFGASGKAIEFEYWGSHVPVLFVLLAGIGLVARRRAGPMLPMPILLMVAVTAVLTLNPGGAPLDLVRKLPLGNGFRVAARFLPFLYFFALVAAAFGLEHILAWQRRWTVAMAMAVLAALACVELYPAQLSPSPVRAFTVPKQVRDEGESGAFTLIMPRGHYTNVLDTYQVSMNIPVVHLSYLAREDHTAAEARRARYPGLYPPPKKLTKGVLAQMQQANVRYVLFEDRAQYEASKYHGAVIAEHDDAVLVRYGKAAEP